MGTYDYKKVLSEYDNGRMTVDMAVGHSLQHIGKNGKPKQTVCNS